MNAPFRTITLQQITNGAVLERSLRAAHDTEVLLSSFVGSVGVYAAATIITDAQRTEARVIARNLQALADTLLAVANGEQKDTV